MKLHPKILELKRRAAPINYRTLSVNEFGGQVSSFEEDLKNGIVNGYGLQWGKPNEYREVFLQGAFAKSIREHGPGANSNYEIKFLNQHKQSDPLSLFESISEDNYGLRFRTMPLDEKDIELSSAASVLRKLAKRTLNNFSIGFDYIWNQMEYDEKNDQIIIREAKLFEISVVSIPADMGTYAMRSMEEEEDLYDDTEEFIKTLPRKFQLEARQLFSRHKSLANLEPLEQRQRALQQGDKPTPDVIDYNFLIQNFKI